MFQIPLFCTTEATLDFSLQQRFVRAHKRLNCDKAEALGAGELWVPNLPFFYVKIDGAPH